MYCIICMDYMNALLLNIVPILIATKHIFNWLPQLYLRMTGITEISKVISMILDCYWET